jgi:hypothetical protein
MMLKQKLKFPDYHSLAFFFLLLWLVALVLSPGNPYLTEIGRDSGVFLYMGARMLAGDSLYVDIWDHKGPAIFFLNAIGLTMVKNSRWGVFFIQFIFLFFAFLSGYLAIKKRWGVASALFGTLTSVYALGQVLGGGNLTEEYALLFGFLAIYLFFEEQDKRNLLIPFLIGVLFGLAFLFRANNGGIQISIGLAILISGLIRKNFFETAKKLFGIGLGAIATVGLAALYFIYQGTFSNMIEAAFIYNILDTSGSTNVLSGLRAGLKHLGIASYIFVAGYIVAVYKLYQFFHQKKNPDKESEILILLVVSWPVEVLLSSLSGLNFLHYFICWVPAVFLLSSFAYKTLSKIVFSEKVVAFMTTARANYVFLFVILIYSYPTLFDYGTTAQAILFNRQSGIDKNSRLADFIRQTTEFEDTVFVWGGEARVNFVTRRLSPTPYTLVTRLLMEHPMNEGISESVYNDIQNNKPALIIDMWRESPDYFPSLDPALREQQDTKRIVARFPAYMQLLVYIREHYVFETRIEGYEVYRLKEY